MSESSSISTGIAERYASAVFDLAKEAGELDKLESDVNAFNDALVESPDLRDLMSNPVYSRSEQSSAIGAIAEKLGVSEILNPPYPYSNVGFVPSSVMPFRWQMNIGTFVPSLLE